mgnify:CR=1 FL=1
MGAQTFHIQVKGKTAQEAFQSAVEKARWDYGHAGYTGTIAEKSEFTMIPLPDDKNADSYAEELIREDDARIGDKWGPAGCIQSGPESFVFFGWASS